MNDQLYRKHNSKYINMFKISPSSPRSSATNATDCNQCLHQATITGEIHCPAQLPMTIETNQLFVLWIMTIELGGLGRLIGMIRPSGGDSLPSLLHWTLFSTDQIKDDSFFNSEGLVSHFTHTVLFYLEGPVWRSLVYI